MSGHFIWDAVTILVLGSIVLGAFVGMAAWSMSEIMDVVNRHLRPRANRLVRGWVRKVREWKATRKRLRD